uniref:Non-structural protein 3a n=1 Tax=Infectious bronchitis virus TaxID=11120 RepID=B2MWM0_9GAMC|nr:3a protein [Infectious bronchitis virus]
MIQNPTSFLVVLILLWCKLLLSCIALHQLIQVLLQIINNNLQSRLILWYSLD